MLKIAQFALPLMVCVTTLAHAQGSSGTAAGGRRSASSTAGKARTPGPKRRANATPTIVSVTGGKGDASTGISPTTLLGLPQLRNAMGVTSGTPIHVRLLTAIDSGHAKDGDTVEGVLTEPLGKAPAGAPVKLTVVAVAAAGTMTSAGELSLQVISVNGEDMLSSVITAQGAQGTALQPDGLPARGAEASITPDTPIQLPAA